MILYTPTPQDLKDAVLYGLTHRMFEVPGTDERNQIATDYLNRWLDQKHAEANQKQIEKGKEP